ncbi:type I-A CRISPR-associated protein Cas7/Csa2 [Metallosphaera tengchongensis]|uniref:Type I-A CRISPR-associated protein Cas7/Csa2 n=1 Tax=Metallosphaera tengchongensis TaxID=1532350 RepID=A0A6N0NVG8_9CREN|nr:type I-A CRISPR-associated protein Cas7/Csa2 [Metallosphaera tengchongensis]QKR00722.1 type I-A CRISPR-associated protein Cas7/Csa2 [Metallosphaera tengchongensis]
MIAGSVRLLINVEALNGVESVGNLVRHRSVPVVFRTSNGYVMRYVPAISGESIAHTYQFELAQLAKAGNLPVTNLSLSGEFVKFASDDFLAGVTPPKDANDARRFEVDVMLTDVVADVGGFLFAGKNPVRRSSRFYVGYMIPTLQGEEIPSQLEAQFHVRYSQSTQQHAIFNVEMGSALYTVSFALDEKTIATPSNAGNQVQGESTLAQQRKSRVEAAIKALSVIMNVSFGGKRSRFLPSAKLQSAVVTMSEFPFMPEPGHSPNYIKDTAERISRTASLRGSQNYVVMAVNNEGLDAGNAKVLSYPEDLITELLKLAK